MWELIEFLIDQHNDYTGVIAMHMSFIYLALIFLYISLHFFT